MTPDSGEKSTRSSNVNIGGGGGSVPPKFSLHRAETAAAWPGFTNLPLWEDTGVAKSWKNIDFPVLLEGLWIDVLIFSWKKNQTNDRCEDGRLGVRRGDGSR